MVILKRRQNSVICVIINVSSNDIGTMKRTNMVEMCINQNTKLKLRQMPPEKLPVCRSSILYPYPYQ